MRDDVLAAVAARVPYLKPATEIDGSWLRCSDLCSDEHLVRSLCCTRDRDPMVGASLFVQAYAFRVGATALAAFGLGLPVPDVTPRVTAIRTDNGRPCAVAHLRDAVTPPDASLLAAELCGEHLASLISTVRRVVKAGERMLWGDVASSSARAFRAVEAPLERALAFFAAARPWLEGLGEFVTVTGTHRESWFFGRTTCCLWYQTAAAEERYCDDCSLLDPDVRVAQWRSQLDGAAQ